MPADTPMTTAHIPRKVWLTATLMGLPIGVLAIALLVVAHELTDLVWEDIPRWIGTSSTPPDWYVIAAPAIGGLLAAAMLSRMSHTPEPGISLAPTPLNALPWLMAGAMATLAFGFVLGPEAPLLALGIALAGIAGRLCGVVDSEHMMMIVVAGAFTVLAVLLASPLVALILLIEMVAASGLVPVARLVPMLLPGLLSGTIGLLVFAGAAGWQGLTPPTFAIPDLPTYPSVLFVDVAWSIPVAVVAAAVILATQRLSSSTRNIMQRNPVLITGAFGALIGATAVAYRAISDRPIDDILYSGQHALPDYTAIAGAGTLLLIVAAKGLAYALSLGAQVEGGPIFPAIALGGALGCAAAIMLPGASEVPMIAVAVSAAAASLQRLPVFGITFALIIIGTDNAMEATLFCIVGALIGVAMAMRAQREAAAH